MGGLPRPDSHWNPYPLSETLTDLEDAFRRWRFRQLRITGMKSGTGGTSGVGDLQHMLDVELFPELWQLRTAL